MYVQFYHKCKNTISLLVTRLLAWTVRSYSYLFCDKILCAIYE